MNNTQNKTTFLERTKLFIKEEPQKLAGIIAALNGLSQLALSNLHIQSLVLVQVTTNNPESSNYTSGMPSTGIAMFNFMFILFTLVTIFNVMRAKTKGGIIVGLVSILITIGFGTVYLLKLTNPDSVQRMSHVMPSLILIIVAFSIYVVCIGLLLFDLFRKKS